MATLPLDPPHVEAFEPSPDLAELRDQRVRAVVWLTLIFWVSNYSLLTLATALARNVHLKQLVLVRFGEILLGVSVSFLFHLMLRSSRLSTTRRRLIALAIPPLAHGVALRGVLEAGQRFRIVNQLRVPLGIATYAGPLIALPFGASARVAVAIVVAARIGYWVARFFVLDSVAPGISRPRALSRVALRELVTVGGWNVATREVPARVTPGWGG